MQPIFLFGALIHAPLRAVVLGGEVFARPALLPDHALLTDDGALWAQLTPAFGSRAVGVILDAPSPEQMARLSFYLEGFGYGFAPLVLGEAGQTALAPLRAGTEPRAGLFDAELWQKTLAETATATARDMMALFGRVSAAAMARRYPAMLVRGAGRLRAAQTAPVTLRHRAGPQDVVLKGWRQPYAGFFAAEESDLSWRRFDGSMNPPVTRAGFVSGDAVTVLPYDPARDRVLLVEQFRSGPYHRGDPQPWQLEPIAGRIDPGETPEEALARELREELGIEAIIGKELQRYQFSYNERPPVDLIFYSITHFTGVPVNYEFEQILWEHAHILPDYDFLEGDREFILWLAERAKLQP